MDSAGNQVHPEKTVWNPEWVKGMGLDVDPLLIARRLTEVSPTQAMLTIENQERGAQTGVFQIWIAPGEDGRILTPPEIPFSLKPGEKTEQTITIEHVGPVYLGADLKGESFVPAGIKDEVRAGGTMGSDLAIHLDEKPASRTRDRGRLTPRRFSMSAKSPLALIQSSFPS